MQWEQVLATRTARMKASQIRELLKLLDQPDIISFAGGIPDPSLFPVVAFQAAMAGALGSGLRRGGWCHRFGRDVGSKRGFAPLALRPIPPGYLGIDDVWMCCFARFCRMTLKHVRVWFRT